MTVRLGDWSVVVFALVVTRCGWLQGRDAMTKLLEEKDNQELWQQIWDVTLKKMTDSDTEVPLMEDDDDAPSPFAGLQSGV